MDDTLKGEVSREAKYYKVKYSQKDVYHFRKAVRKTCIQNGCTAIRKEREIWGGTLKFR